MSRIESHPKFQDLEGFSSTCAFNHYQAVQVYIDLSECKGWWNLQVRPCSKDKVLFVSGHETQFEPQTFVLPIRSDAEMSMAELDGYKETVKETFNSDTFLLGIVDPDSAVVYYRISDGLVPPERPEDLEAKKLKSLRYRERRKQRHMKYTNIADTVSLKSGLTHKAPASPSQCPSTVECSQSVPCHASGHLNSESMDIQSTSNNLGMDRPCTSYTQSHSREGSKNVAVSTSTEKSSSLFDHPDGKLVDSEKLQKESASDSIIQNESDRRTDYDLGNKNGVESAVNDNTSKGGNAKDSCLLFSNEEFGGSQRTDSNDFVPAKNQQRSLGTSVQEGQTYGEFSEFGRVEVEGSRDRTMDEEEMEPNQDVDDDHRVLNMAPEDFEDVVYSDDDLQGEL